jgi:hypothetical protein
LQGQTLCAQRVNRCKAIRRTIPVEDRDSHANLGLFSTTGRVLETSTAATRLPAIHIPAVQIAKP